MHLAKVLNQPTHQVPPAGRTPSDAQVFRRSGRVHTCRWTQWRQTRFLGFGAEAQTPEFSQSAARQ